VVTTDQSVITTDQSVVATERSVVTIENISDFRGRVSFYNAL
jgi:hypothetical protein